ncbi:MAG: serine/threonine protein kinase, partial [Planctomycetaceae bacterium]
MITCPTCQSSFSDDEAQDDSCPICGGSVETSQDRDIARSMAIPKNWAANLDALSDLFDSTDVASVQAVMNARDASPVSKKVEPTKLPTPDLGVEEMIEELSPLSVEKSDGSTVETQTTAEESEVEEVEASPQPIGRKPEPQADETEPPLHASLYQTISRIERGVSPTTSMKIEPGFGMRSLSSMAEDFPGEGFGSLENPNDETELRKSQSFSRESLVVRPRTFSDAPDIGDRAAEYRLLDLLGEGGMGKVFRAKQTSIDREVAVKMLRKDLDDGDTQQKFLAEAVVTGDLDHPNIVPIYELGTDDKGELFYSMKRVQGTPWMDVIAEKSESENIEILMRTADAVAFAHSRGVIHRDLKPENIMLGSFGEVLVMDWGLALTTEVFNESHGVKPEAGLGGTPVYMAPEMILAEPEDIGPTADVYLLGAILYEIITGRPPHTGKDAQDCLVSVARNKIVPTTRTGEIVNIALKAMSTKPADRFESVQEFQDCVREYQSHAESVALSTRASEDLAAAAESTDYQDYARALFGFQEAVELWSGNEKANAGVVEARIAYASNAFQKGDYDLAASLPEVGSEVEDQLLNQIHAAQKERAAKELRLKFVRRVAAALVLAVTCVVLGAFFWIRAEADKAKQAEAIASKERDEADVQRQSAIVAKGVAEKKTTEALEAKVAADAARKDAETKRQ